MLVLIKKDVSHLHHIKGIVKKLPTSLDTPENVPYTDLSLCLPRYCHLYSCLHHPFPFRQHDLDPPTKLLNFREQCNSYSGKLNPQRESLQLH